jgi:hypothetical protein
MKLTPAQIEQATHQMEAKAVPEEGQLAPQLHKVFGDHTFFLGNDGLQIVHAVEAPQKGTHETRVVKLASWADPERTTLAPHDPEVTETVVALERAA